MFLNSQIKKYGKPECNFCLPIRLPEEVFNELHFIPDPTISTGIYFLFSLNLII